jgi:tryptophan-rich sensory protein
MRLSAPTHIVFYISVALFVLALIAHFAHVAALSPYQLWLALAAYVVLAAGTMFKGA